MTPEEKAFFGIAKHYHAAFFDIVKNLSIIIMNQIIKKVLKKIGNITILKSDTLKYCAIQFINDEYKYK
jgi:hypothetical protein